MIRYSSVVSIKRAPTDVFAALLDPDRYSEWTPMVDTRFHDKDPRVGSYLTYQELSALRTHPRMPALRRKLGLPD